MNGNSAFLILEQPCEPAIELVTRQMGHAGLRVTRTFDLQAARTQHAGAQASCACPYHGTQQCACQMVVLLVYGKDPHPASLIVHGNDALTSFSMMDTPQFTSDPHLEGLIRQAVTAGLAAAGQDQGS